MEVEKTVKDLVVDVSPTEVRIALMNNHRLIELNKESCQGHGFSVGDVFLGRVKKLLPTLNAAFVDIGDSKEAFIHYLDLGLYFNAFDSFVKESNPNRNLKELYSGISLGPVLAKEGRIEDHLKVGQMVIAQIVKEPISTKGSRLSAEISLAGRNIVLLPFADKVSVSQKIKKATGGTGRQHSPEKLRSNHPHRRRRQESRGSGSGSALADREMGEFVGQDCKKQRSGTALYGVFQDNNGTQGSSQ